MWPMATVKEILVYFTVPFFLFLLIWRSEGKNQTGLWLITVRETHWISVLPDGTVHSSTTTPTLYSKYIPFPIPTLENQFEIISDS